MNTQDNQAKPVIIDIEASGLGENSYPIEIGIALPDGGAHCYLIHPYAEWTHWESDAEKLHRLSRATLVRFGMDGAYVARQLNKFLDGKAVYSDSLAREQAWLDTLYTRAGMTPSFKLEDLATITSVEQSAHWDVVCEQVINELGLKRHRASADARIIQSTWLRTLDQRRSASL